MNKHTAPQRHKPAPIRFTLAERLHLQGQHLRATETASVTTFALSFAARRVAEMPLVAAGRQK